MATSSSSFAASVEAICDSVVGSAAYARFQSSSSLSMPGWTHVRRCSSLDAETSDRSPLLIDDLTTFRPS
jgi:hypothetical protein